MRKQIFVLVPDLCKKYFDRDKDICYHINHASIPIRGMHVIVYSNESTSLLRRRRIEMKKYGVNELRFHGEQGTSCSEKLSIGSTGR